MRDLFLELEQLTDDHLRQRLAGLVRGERAATAALIAHLAEFDARRIHLADGYSSLFAWCTRALHYSEHEAYLRIEVARVVRRFPAVLDHLADGSVHLTAVSLLAPHLTGENHAALLEATRHRTKREVEELVAALRPAAPVPSPRPRIVPLPCGPVTGAAAVESSDGMGVGDPAAPAGTPQLLLVPPVESSSAPRPGAVHDEVAYRLHITIPKRTLDRLDRARDLMRHQVPDGDAAAILDRALELLIEQLERRKFAALIGR